MRVPKIAPSIWAIMYRPPRPHDMCPVRQLAKVTAGFTWPPDTLAVAYTAAKPCYDAHYCSAIGYMCRAYGPIDELDKTVFIDLICTLS